MKITTEELFATIADFVQVGYMQAVKAYEPTNDNIRQSDVCNWLRLNLIDERQFKQLERKGLIKSFRLGTAKNSPLYYSKEEIKQAISTEKVGCLIVHNRINFISNEKV